MNITFRYSAVLFLLMMLIAFPISAQDDTELAKKTQNPVSDLISVPFQNNLNFGTGPDDDNLQYILNIQPVYPININTNWNWIHRVIAPIIHQPEISPLIDSETGLGDIVYQGFLSPAAAVEVVWGVGPVVSFPTASDEILGSEKWSLGPGAVILRMSGPWVYGVLANNVWSVGGESDRNDVNFMTLQYFVNYNFPGGLYFTSAPINTANWEADSGDRWTVPLGGGFGKILEIGTLPLNTSVQAFYNVEEPENTAEWSLRVQLQMLFPKK